MPMDTEVRQIASSLREYMPVSWESMPDLELYMDQVITYLEREFALFQDAAGNKLITRSMINNYVKDGIVPRPVKKRYARPQLGALTMACLLKRTMPMQSVKEMVVRDGEELNEETYGAFCREFQSVSLEQSELLDGLIDEAGMSRDRMYQLALCFAIRSSIDRYVADRLLDELSREEDRERP